MPGPRMRWWEGSVWNPTSALTRGWFIWRMWGEGPAGPNWMILWAWLTWGPGKLQVWWVRGPAACIGEVMKVGCIPLVVVTMQQLGGRAGRDKNTGGRGPEGVANIPGWNCWQAGWPAMGEGPRFGVGLGVAPPTIKEG